MQKTPRKRFKLSTPKLSKGKKSKAFYDDPIETQDEEGKLSLKFKCKLCEKEINGTKEYNLSCHLEHMHRDVYFSHVKLTKKESLLVKRLRILLNAVELVTVNGRPFNALLDSGYQAGIINKLNKLKEAGMEFSFADPKTEIKRKLAEIADKIRKQIRSEVNKRMISVMVDIGTKNKRSVFGVSVQFIVGKKLVVRSLGLIELEESHTGIFLSKILFEHLKKFGIEKKQVITITTDNGSNMIKMVRDFNNLDIEIPNVNFAQRSLFNEFNEDEETIDMQIENLLAEAITEEDALEILFHGQEVEAGSVLPSLVSEFIGTERIWDTTGVNCVVHTVQLGVGDSLKLLDLRHKNVIELGREVAKFLRKQTTCHEIHQKGLRFSVPHLECQTRWSSTAIMVNLFFIFKHECHGFSIRFFIDLI